MTTLEQTAGAIEQQYGPVAARYVRASADRYAAELATYAQRLPTMTDTQLVAAASAAVYDSATAARFPGFEHLEAKASMVAAESERRLKGHTGRCRPTSLYQLGWNRAVREAGHSAMATPVTECSCKTANA